MKKNDFEDSKIRDKRSVTFINEKINDSCDITKILVTDYNR